MANASGVTQRLTDGDIEFVDLCFTDPRGKMQHVTMETKEMGEDAFAEGVMFDGSSIAGCKAINESDMTLMPTPESAHLDPFFAQSTLAIFCDIHEPSTSERYGRDPRGIARKAEAYTKCVVKDGIVTADCPIGDYDMMAQFIVQVKNAVVAVGWSAAGSLIVFMINSLIVGLSVSEGVERE
ncbi:MAG TPA: glutamine synthetase beta-grasp domain-containing protein, partial [Xanthobacteraceae bacterium]|nr:glutamine synthetase beta-grasp domain-containing protein [Xanthobacteraceae bacterium]